MLGRTRYWSLVVGTIIFCVGFGTLMWWLSEKTGWPDDYGFHCRGRGCELLYLMHSPELLARGGTYEIALFAALWFLPAILFGFLSWAFGLRLIKWIKQRRNRIRSMDD